MSRSVYRRLEENTGGGEVEFAGTELGSVDFGSLQDHATALLLALPGEQGGARGVLKHLSHTLVGLGRALEVLLCANLLADILSLER